MVWFYGESVVENAMGTAMEYGSTCAHALRLIVNSGVNRVPANKKVAEQCYSIVQIMF